MPALARRLDESCRRFAGRVALLDDAETLSYDDAAMDAEAVAAALRREGLTADEPVAVAVSNRARDLVAFHGVWRAGGVVVPVHRTATAASAGAVLAQTGARFVVNGRPKLEAPPALATGKAVVRLDRPAPPARPLLEGAALVVFSSGTTGEPKGVVVGHDRFAAKLDMIDHMLGFEDGVRSLLVLQLTFSFGQWVSLLTLLHGGRLALHARFEADAVLAAIEGGAIDRAAFVPTMLRALVPRIAPGRGAGWRGTIMAGGEVLPAALACATRTAWPEAALWDIYGLTETGTCDFFVRPADYDEAAGSIGRPGTGIAHRLAGPDGELQIRTPYGMLGYLDAPALTEAAFADGWFRTGDLARERADGRVELVGRAKELIIRAGNKISPLEVERVFLAHPDVAAALAAGVPDPRTGEAIHLFVVPRAGADTAPGALVAWAAGRIERYKRPDVIHLGTDLPVGRTGKADRRALRALIEGGGLQH